MKKGISRLAVCLFWLGVWQAASLLVAQELFIPSPRRVGERLFALAGNAVFWKAIGATLLRIAAGYAGGMCLGSLFGLLTWRIPALHRLFAPLLALLRAAPVSSFILLVLLWVPAGLVPVCISTLLVAGLFWQTVYDGAHSMDKLLLEMAQVYRLSPRVRFRAILWPSIRPVFLSTASGALNGYPGINKNDRDTHYYKRVYLGCVRAVDFIFSLPEFDGSTVGVTGGSQGGALSIVTAGLDPRIKFLAAFYPALCDYAGYLHQRAGGWPHYYRNAKPGPNEVETLAYFDVVNFARRVNAPGWYSWGYNDVTCPPTSMYSAYNVIPGAKELHLYLETGHWTYPEQNMARFQWLKEMYK